MLLHAQLHTCNGCEQQHEKMTQMILKNLLFFMRLSSFSGNSYSFFNLCSTLIIIQRK